MEAGVFAREFLMPAELFNKSYLENCKFLDDDNQFFDVSIQFDKIAKTFEIDDIQVNARGRELGLWK